MLLLPIGFIFLYILQISQQVVKVNQVPNGQKNEHLIDINALEDDWAAKYWDDLKLKLPSPKTNLHNYQQWKNKGNENNALNWYKNVQKPFNPPEKILYNSEFLNFVADKFEDLAQLGDKKCSCGKHFLREMQKIKYGDWHFRVWPFALGAGTTSNVFHAHAMSNLLDFDGNPLKLKQCVALKSVLLKKAGNGIETEMRNEMEILKRFARINSKRVIRLFSFKDLYWNRQLLILMELGEHNLKREFANNKEKMLNYWHYEEPKKGDILIQQTIEKTFTQILEAVKEMHKLVIHLDLKPENMLYVKEADGKGGHKMTLKVIDFGGSELIPDHLEVNPEKRANVCKLRYNMWSTDFYSSPEQKDYCKVPPFNYQFSIKSDIWAVGTMLLELLMTAPMFHYEPIQHRTAIKLIVSHCRYGENLESEILYMPDYIKAIVENIREDFAHYYEMLKATLNKKPIDRTTARGLLDYIAGKCQLKMPEENKNTARSNSHLQKLQSVVTNGLVTILRQKLPECDHQTTGNPLALSNEAKSNEFVVRLNSFEPMKKN